MLRQRIVHSRPVTKVRRGLNSSPLVPGPLRVIFGGRIWVSADYRLAPQSGDLVGWSNPRVARRQHRMWRHMVNSGAISGRPDVANLREALAATAGHGKLLEVGCGSGYNRSLIRSFGQSFDYTGVDNSPAMVALARDVDPGGIYMEADATDLPFASDSFDVVVDGGTLMHVPEWAKALAQECRVARNHLVLHSLTVTDAATTALHKRAYGYRVPEMVINRTEIREELSRNGFDLASTAAGIPYDLNDVVGIPTSSETWLCVARAITDPD